MALLFLVKIQKELYKFLHGMCEHKERYIDFMNFLSNQGYLCIIHDHRGHGKSIKNKNDLGYFYDNGHLAIVEDLPSNYFDGLNNNILISHSIF